MKKLTVILMVLILAAGMVFASSTVTLNSEVAAGTGATKPGADNADIIGGSDEQGFWLSVSYYTDNLTTTLKKVSGASENARLTGNGPVSGLIDSLTFVVNYSGNVRESGSVASIKFSTQGWKGTAGEANADETVDIALAYNKVESGLPEGLSASDLTNGAFSVSYPAGLIAETKTVATVGATWAKSNNLIAGDYQATITVTVNGN